MDVLDGLLDGPRARHAFLLRAVMEPRATVGSVARAVGYASPFGLSAAFKRARGQSPREHQRQAS
jgi:AraC-like DNA-binding protein